MIGKRRENGSFAGTLRRARRAGAALKRSRMGLTATLRSYKSRSSRTAQRLDRLVGSARLALIRTTTDGLVTGWNDAAEELLGYSAAEVRGRPITILAPPEEGEKLSPLLEKARSGPAQSVGAALRRKDGRDVEVSLSISPARDAGGRIAGALFSARMRSARSEEPSHAEVIESSDDAIVSQTLDGIITGWNKGAEWIYGYPAEEALRRPISILAPPGRPDESFRILERIARGERVGHYETTRVRKDGKPIVVSVTASPIVDRQGRVIGASGISRDITERKQAEEALVAKTEQLARVNAELELFTAAAAHDFQEPLRKVLMTASRLAARPGLEASVLREVRRIEESARRMRRLAQALSEYAQTSSSPLRREPVDLRAQARAAALDLAPQIRETRARILVGKSPRVCGDPGQIRRLLRHLIANAVKFRRAGKRPVVRIGGRTVPGRGVELFVEDNGIGIAPDYLKKIFDPFRRLHGQQSFEGAGLGLSICRRIMWRHGGSIEARSVLGRGSRFTALFPPARRNSRFP